MNNGRVEAVVRVAWAERESLLRLLRARTGDDDEADDLFAELLAGVAAGAGPGASEPVAWLRARARSLAGTRNRSRRREAEALGPLTSLDQPRRLESGEVTTLAASLAAGQPTPEEQVCAAALATAVAAAIGRLAAADRELLRAAARLGPAAAALEQSLDRATLHRRLRRARARLYAALPADLRSELAPLLRGRARRPAAP